MGKKINRARTKRKQSMDDVAMGIHILNFAHSFGKGMLPHNSGSLPRECLKMYMDNEEFQARASNKSAYDYVVYLQKLYTLYVNAKFYKDIKDKNLKKLEECNQMIKEFEDSTNATV